jgi:hypothetical protein
MSCLRPFESFIGLFHGLLGMLVDRQVIFLTWWAVASRRAWTASLVKLSRSQVRVILHKCWPSLESG